MLQAHLQFYCVYHLHFDGVELFNLKSVNVNTLADRTLKIMQIKASGSKWFFYNAFFTFRMLRGSR